MSTATLNSEFAAITLRTRRLIGGSTIIHLLLILLLMYQKTTAASNEGITEITWIEPAAPAPVVEELAPPVARKETPDVPVQRVRQEPTRQAPAKQFRRELKRAAVAPRPQEKESVEDVLSQKMQSLESVTETRTRMAALVEPPKVGTPAPVGVPDKPPVATPSAELKRDTTIPSTAPADLRRAPTTTSRPTNLARPTNQPPVRTSVDPAEASGTVRNVAGGAQLAGPVADRPLLSFEKPVYPEWAKRDGVEASVTLRFFVLPNGTVKENILVEKTSGFSDFDNNAKTALLQFQFEPLKGAAEQWGRITFNYRLSDGK